MNKHKLVLAILLWSGSAYSSVQSTLRTVSEKEFVFKFEETAIENMPRYRNQDSLGVCFGFSSSTVAQFYMCKQKNIPCQPLEEKKEVSPMSMTAWSNPNEKYGGSWERHTNIRFAGLGYYGLRFLSSDSGNAVRPESCFPFDQLANKYGSDKEAIDAVVGKLRKEYDRSKTEGSACEECLLNIVQKDLGAKTNAKDLAIGLKAKTFEQFLYGAFMGSCTDRSIRLPDPSPQTGYFPKENQTANYSQLMNEIKNVLSTGYPLVLDAVCPFTENGKCLGGHSVVISGYRRVCKDKEKKQCRDVLKIQNSWGEDWQRQNDDGWLDAKILLGDKKFEEGAISWWTPKK